MRLGVAMQSPLASQRSQKRYLIVRAAVTMPGYIKTSWEPKQGWNSSDGWGDRDLMHIEVQDENAVNRPPGQQHARSDRQVIEDAEPGAKCWESMVGSTSGVHGQPTAQCQLSRQQGSCSKHSPLWMRA